jgi:hypothetical protein
MLMKRLALKISKEMSIDREQRGTVGQQFLQECFSEFNAALEQANPIEKKIQNFLALGQQPPVTKPMSFMNLAAAAVSNLTPKRASMDFDGSFTSYGKMSPPEGTRAKMIWGLLGTSRKAESSPPESESPPNQTCSTPEEDYPRVRDGEP